MMVDCILVTWLKQPLTQQYPFTPCTAQLKVETRNKRTKGFNKDSGNQRAIIRKCNSIAKEGYAHIQKFTYRFTHPLAFRAMYCYTSSHMHPSK
jgi:hypothetical protein